MESVKEAIQATTMLAQTIELKDGYTEDHCERLAATALAIGKRLGLAEERLEQLRYGALLHDVGKLGITDNILGKLGRLTTSEWAEVRKHPTIGKEIVEKIKGLGLVAQIVEEHHERVDGKGYPKGLKGDEILLEARILAVVDAYDAMRSDRPYRQALSREEAIRELRENAGSQFDPLVVKVFLEILDEETVCVMGVTDDVVRTNLQLSDLVPRKTVKISKNREVVGCKNFSTKANRSKGRGAKPGAFLRS